MEEVLPDVPAEVRLVTGRRACPAEDSGGIDTYAELAAWLEGGYDDALLPKQFGASAHARDVLPLDGHPAVFDVNLTAEAIREALDELDDNLME